jgi:hypothetical protein
LPWKVDRYGGADREKDACENAAPGLGTAKQRMTIWQDQSSIDRTSKTNARDALEQDGRAICGTDQEEALKDSESMKRHRDLFALTRGNDKQ